MTVPVPVHVRVRERVRHSDRLATFTLTNLVVNSNSCGTPHIPQQCVTYFRDVILTLSLLKYFHCARHRCVGGNLQVCIRVAIETV